MKKNLLLLVAALASVGALASCGGTTSKETSATKTETPTVTPTETPTEAPAVAAKLVASYIGTFDGGYYIPAYSMVQSGYDNYVVDLYDDNTYVSNRVTYMNMYGTLGSVVITTTGSYATSENEDGDKIVSLSDAASILYTTCGMFNMQYSWNNEGIEDTTFPVALMGTSSASDTFDFFKTEYGFGYSFLTTDSNCLIKEVYLPTAYAEHFHTQADAEKGIEEKILYKLDGVVNAYSGEAKAHDFNKAIKHIYVGTFEGGYYIPAYSMVQAGYDNYVVTTFADGTYDAINVKYMNMYGTLGSVTLKTQGTYTETENEDGDVIVNMGAASSIIYTTCGMFNMQYAYGTDGIAQSTFPVSLMGSSSASDSLELFQSEYGYAYSFVTTDSNCLIGTLNLPENIAAHYAKDEEPATEETSETTAEETTQQ